MVVAIGGFDPSCGAGVVADARSIEAMGAVPLAVVTSITVQSGSGVRSFSPVSSARVLAQLDELLGNLPVAAVKVGQVPNAALAEALGKRLGRAGLPLVLDPVLGASGGGRLVQRATPAAITRWLAPRATLLTVNLAEAATLTGREVADLDGMRAAAAKLGCRGTRSVLVKGGHLEGDPVDLFFHQGEEFLFRGRRIRGSMHGTGCAMASAIAARIALGDDLTAAVRAARRHVRMLLTHAVNVGEARLRAPASY